MSRGFLDFLKPIYGPLFFKLWKESIQYILIKESLYNYIQEEKYTRIVKDKTSNICVLRYTDKSIEK